MNNGFIECFCKILFSRCSIQRYIFSHFEDSSNIYKMANRYFIEKYFYYLVLKKGKGIIKVLNGPFKGLIYPNFKSKGSALNPKLLGSYERELIPIIELIKKGNYAKIIDIGCAEGYYAVGLAKSLNNSKVYAYDVNKSARKLCLKMARCNCVEERIYIGRKCTSDVLKSLEFKVSNKSCRRRDLKKNLIISDCEGYERILFNKSLVNSLLDYDILIEVHEFNSKLHSNSTTFKYLINIFKSTHDYQVIDSVSDLKKVYTYKYDEIKELSNDQKLFLLAEGRPYEMKWIFFTPKNC